MATLKPQFVPVEEPPTSQDTGRDDVLEVDDEDEVDADDSLMSTKGSSLNYVRWYVVPAFCADKSSFKGET